VTCLIIYVDDMVITENDEKEIKRLKEGLFAEFKMKDLGNLTYFLGIEVLRSPKGIFICQKKYILDLLAEIGMINCKPADTHMMVNQKLFMQKKAKLADRNRYQRVGRKTDIFIIYSSRYCTCCWGGKSVNAPTTGYFSLVGGNLVTWRSKKQKVVSFSSAEAKFRALGRLLDDIHVTWAHLEKKRTRLQLYTKVVSIIAHRAWRRRRNFLATSSDHTRDVVRK
nr:hypothetical protein [Tanacetum cinerariifolium]